MRALRVGAGFVMLGGAAFAGDFPVLKMRPQTIDAAIEIGYGLAVADVDGDGTGDVLLADAKQIVWYRAPAWEKFVMTDALTKQDHVCIAARDLNGDGKAEVAVGAEWNPGDTVNSGAVFLLEAPADRKEKWTARRLPHEPTTHRMAWVRTAEKEFSLAVLPLHGRGNKNSAGTGVEFLGYEWPWRAESEPVRLWPTEPALHATHNLDVLPAGEGANETILAATKEGVRLVDLRKTTEAPRTITTTAAGEVRSGWLGDGRRFVATIEPMHGNQLAVYQAAEAGVATWGDWSGSRVVLDENMVQGHALAVGDLLGVGSDQIVVGWRGGGRGGRSGNVGIKVWVWDATEAAWRVAAVVDKGQMACEDLKVADLNGDGRLDIVAAGRATKNVVIYWNETTEAEGAGARGKSAAVM